jgi:foldase protein PrsA
MNPLRITLVALGAAATLALTACGGAGDVPAGAVAVVGGAEITRAELDAWVETAKKGYAANDREFPKVGTPEYQSIQSQFLAYLVQQTEFEQAAEDLGIDVTEKDVDKAYEELAESRYNGDEDALEKELEKQGFTLETLRKMLRNSVLAQKLFQEVTKDVKVTDEDALAYYKQNQSQFGTPAIPESRDVRHILIAEKAKDGGVDYAKSKEEADRIYAELKDGADFSELAKEFSDDTTTGSNGGKLTIRRGETVPEFDTTAFLLPEGSISRPVKTQFGYHVIEPLGPVKPGKPGKTTPFAKVKDQIRASLLQQRRNETMTQWVEDLEQRYESKVSYAAGFEPPAIPESPTETQ